MLTANQRKYCETLALMISILYKLGNNPTEIGIALLKEAQSRVGDDSDCTNVGLLAANLYATNPSPKSAVDASLAISAEATGEIKKYIEELSEELKPSFQRQVRDTTRSTHFLLT